MSSLPIKKPVLMVSARQHKDFATRLDELKHLLNQLQQNLEDIRASGEIAPPGCWIVRYQAKGRKGGRYWYYKWMSHDLIFVTKNGNPSCHQYLGKAGSEAYLNAVEALSRRGRIEALDRAINTLLMGLEDLVEESSRLKQGGSIPFWQIHLFIWAVKSGSYSLMRYASSKMGCSQQG
ncbi:MAG: hypothetical protein AB4426_03345 [Xenococcaceae cyanobacterium]